jgi:hypothetical protein
MRRKNRKWVAIAVGIYLLVMWSAYRWAVAQRPADGNILAHIEREEVRKLQERLAQEAEAGPKPMGESRLNTAGPAFVAARYDESHVVFMVAAETESRFAAASHFAGPPNKIPAPPKLAAPLAGLQELWEPDSQALHFFPEIVQKTQPGEEWSLSVSPDATIPVVIDRTVTAPTGCSLAMGFLATVPIDQRPAFAAASQEYFVVRRKAVESEDPPMPPRLTALLSWRASSAAATQIEQQLNERMKQEVAKIDARLIANAGSPGATAGESPVGHAQPRLKEWIHVDHGLVRGEGKLDYDVRAFRLTPDGAPRLFVRARWKLANAPVFLMSAWFKAEPLAGDAATVAESAEANKLKVESSQGSLDASSNASSKTAAAQGPLHPEASPALLSADSSWSSMLREGTATGALGESLDFQTILNEFDADHDGWAELLIHSDQGTATTITLYLYSDMGLAPFKSPLRREAQSPESCVDP